MMRYALVLFLVLTVTACRKDKHKDADRIQEPILLKATDEIAFIAQTAGGFQLFIMQADGSNLRAISANDITNEPVAVSHDGNKFVYSSFNMITRTGSLYMINKTGGAPVLLTSGPVHYGRMSWSPDDRKIIFQRHSFDVASGVNVCIIDSSGTNEVQLTTDNRSMLPHWFPDGNRIIYNSAGDNPGVYTMNADGSGKKLIVAGITGADAIVSPAGDQVALSFISGTRSLLYVMDANGSNLKLIVTALSSSLPSTAAFYKYVELSPAWSPDGSKIVYAAYVDHNTDLFVINSDGSGNKRLLKSGRWESNPSWTKDGQHILYLGTEDGIDIPKIYVMRSNGDSPTLLSNREDYIMYPVFIGQ